MKNFKSFFVLFLTAAVLVFCAWSFAEAATKKKPSAMSDDEALSVYGDLLQAFRDYEESGWEKYDSPLIQDSWLVIPQAGKEWGWDLTPENWDSSMSGAGFDINNSRVIYSLRDLNDDGAPELIIGIAESGDDKTFYWVFGVYAIVDGKARSVFQKGDPRSQAGIYTDGTIGLGCAISGLAQELRYSLSKDGTLVTEYNIGSSYEWKEDGEEIITYFQYEGDYVHYEKEGNETPLTEEQANELFDRCSKEEAELEWQAVTNERKAPAKAARKKKSAAMSDEEFIRLCQDGTPEEIQAAIDDGANVNAKSTEGADMTPLLSAANWNREAEVVDILLKAGADAGAKDNLGMTPLMFFAHATDDPEIITALVASGADVNAKSNEGGTALLEAAGFNGNPEVIAALVEAGADVNAKYKSGTRFEYLTDLDFARENENDEVVSILEEAGAAKTPAKGAAKKTKKSAAAAQTARVIPESEFAEWENKYAAALREAANGEIERFGLAGFSEGAGEKELSYSFCDIDGNGTAELIFLTGGSDEDDLDIVDIYGAAGGEPASLNGEDDDVVIVGDSCDVSIYSNGEIGIYWEAWAGSMPHGLNFYKINGDATALELVIEAARGYDRSEDGDDDSFDKNYTPKGTVVNKKLTLKPLK
jgi:hypothetical protein